MTLFSTNNHVITRNVKDIKTWIGDVFLPIVSILNGAYIACQVYGLSAILRGAKNFKIHPNSLISIMKGAQLTVNGKIEIGFPVHKNTYQPYMGSRCGLTIGKNSQVVFGNNVRIAVGSHIHAQKSAQLTIGDNTFISYHSQIIASEKIHIGNNCAISWGVTILDSDLHQISGRKISGNIIIEDNVLICHNVSILQNVKIGKNSVVGAGTIVTKDIPPYSIVVGNPNKILRGDIEWK